MAPEKARLAHRAALGGRLPEDQEIRSAALRIASTHVAEYMGRTRWLFGIVFVLVLIGSAAGAISESRWDLLGVLVPALVLYARWYWPRRLRQRIELLTEAPRETTR